MEFFNLEMGEFVADQAKRQENRAQRKLRKSLKKLEKSGAHHTVQCKDGVITGFQLRIPD